jgi:hypothetical protein
MTLPSVARFGGGRRGERGAGGAGVGRDRGVRVATDGRVIQTPLSILYMELHD